RGADQAEEAGQNDVSIKHRVGPLHPLIGQRALALVGGSELALAMDRCEIAHDGVALPEDESIILDHWDQPVRVELAEFRRVEAAKRSAGIDPLMRQAELAHRPHDRLDVARRLSTPDLQHLFATLFRPALAKRLSITPNANAPAGETRWRALATLAALAPQPG